jgi:hypothetical protein
MHLRQPSRAIAPMLLQQRLNLNNFRPNFILNCQSQR